MEQKHIGIILIITAIILSIFVVMIQINDNRYTQEYVAKEGTCFLEDGTCLHKQNLPLYIFGWSVSAALLIFGIYLTFFDKTQDMLKEHQITISGALEKAKKEERQKDEFNAFLAGFDEETQKLLKAVKNQEGIQQSTLRYRTGISKTQLSLLLKNLEVKGLITRKPFGKTKKIYLVDKF